METEGHDIKWWFVVVLSPSKVNNATFPHFLPVITYKMLRWSFGGNRLSLKAEIRLMTDVSTALRGLEAIGLGSIGALKSLAAKHDLLLSLLDNEQMRLEVWLWPLDHEKRHFFPSANSSKLSQEVSIAGHRNQRLSANKNKANLLRLLECAWLEDSSLAIHFPTRYRSPRLADEVRLLLMSFPERATAEPDALKVLLGNSLPSDVTVQMKVVLLLYDLQQTLTAVVPALLETSQSRHGRYVFLARIQKPPVHYSICHARLGKPLGGCDLLLCASDSTDFTLRYSRVCSAIHY